MTFTNESDANPARFKVKNQDWVDTGTITVSHRTRFGWICSSYKDNMKNKIILILIIYIYIYISVCVSS